MALLGEMDADNIVGYFRGKSILITGSTGFLGNVLVEKILRIQPDVKKLFLLIRASGLESAKLRFHNEVIVREIFKGLKEKHGIGFDNVIKEKICPLVGDIAYENFGLDTVVLTELSAEIDIIINEAATTNFFERYDVAFNTNVLGAKHICEIANKCTKLKMLLHVSTAYVAGEQVGLIPEKPFLMGETLKKDTYLDIKSELSLIKEAMGELKANCSTEKDERKTMKELGLKRARHFGWPNTYVFTKAMGEMLLGHLRGDYPLVIIRPSIITSTFKDPLPGWIEGIKTMDSVIAGYAKQNMSLFLVDVNLIVDIIPGDMVVNAMLVAMAAHSKDQKTQIIYHVTSSLCNPAPWGIVVDSMHRYFSDNPPCTGKNGEHVRLKKMKCFSTVAQLTLYTYIKYKIPIEMLRLVNIMLFGVFSPCYNNISRNYQFFMQLIKFYKPYALFKGCFDDTNLENLKKAMKKGKTSNGADFDFDPKSIDWADYFYSVHIPGLLKYISG